MHAVLAISLVALVVAVFVAYRHHKLNSLSKTVGEMVVDAHDRIDSLESKVKSIAKKL